MVDRNKNRNSNYCECCSFLIKLFINKVEKLMEE